MPELKDWVPVIAPTAALLGVLITVSTASRNYRHGLVEARKDRQRELVSDLLAETRRLVNHISISCPAMASMTANDLVEYANTDSMATQGELLKSVQNSRIRCLCEFRDQRIRPLLGELDGELQDLFEGPEVAPVLDPHEPHDRRFKAAMVVVGRLGRIKHICDQLQGAAVEALPVEIEFTTWRRRWRVWLSGTNTDINTTIQPHY